MYFGVFRTKNNFIKLDSLARGEANHNNRLNMEPALNK